MSVKSINTGSDLSKVDAHAIQPEEYEELPELDDAFFERADLYKGEKLIRAGRPKSPRRKVLLSVRYSPEVVEYFRATGAGWQTRMDDALKEWLKEHAT
jgi:uncharacterized protein (DUF4415 family)